MNCVDFLLKYNEIKKYRETSLDNHGFLKQHYYHSIIDLNLIKLDLILKYGILSRDNLINSKLPLITIDNVAIDNVISISEYNDAIMFDPMYESFSKYALSSLTIMLDKNLEKEELSTLFFDEYYVKDYIDKSYIKGIIVPEHISNKSLLETKPLANNVNCYKIEYIDNWIKCMELYFGKKIDKSKIINSLKELTKILNSYKVDEKYLINALIEQKNINGYNFDNILASIIKELWEEKLKINNPKYIDIIKILNNNEHPIYEMGVMQLKKINK